ncbi:MAG: hypothetical protein COW13_02895 [Candidatus Omnitrophica bacterium CG12_big_fil_rev_8_21_14_0_65_50_5]|nr:MAG: hypothetical protein COW13_02895 [Candidatus Omnitrophica bacterium CG12_big_fil_rev_8_21_14_0_65_50_5]
MVDIHQTHISKTDIFQKIGEFYSLADNFSTKEQLLQKTLSAVLDIFQANRGSFFLFDDGNKELTLEVSQGLPSRERSKVVKQMGEGIIGRVAELKKPFVVENISSDKRFKGYKSSGQYQTSSFICAPVIIKDRLIGVINISDKQTGSAFTEDDLQILDFFCNQIALNYIRIELYEKFQLNIQEMEHLKARLSQTDEEARNLRKKVLIQEKLATIGKLAGGIAHEFNNPLDGVMRYTNLCLHIAGEDEVLLNYLMEIKHGLQRMANIVKNLLACSRNDSPRGDKLNAADVCERALSMIRGETANKNIKVIKNIPPDLPALDDLGIERALINIMRNAVDAMESGGSLTLEASCEPMKSLVFKISDTGHGIPEHLLQDVFDPFFTTKEIDKGCGLGLTIVDEIIKSYNGKIRIDSKAGKGTTFTLEIPPGQQHG